MTEGNRKWRKRAEPRKAAESSQYNKGGDSLARRLTLCSVGGVRVHSVEWQAFKLKKHSVQG